MALRVLLADNSESIRKVIQLSLQDFAVEVKTVALGVDVLEIAKGFKPDVIFVDILLQKKNGSLQCKTPNSHDNLPSFCPPREDMAKLANVLAWDAVGAQIEPYLCQHA